MRPPLHQALPKERVWDATESTGLPPVRGRKLPKTLTQIGRVFVVVLGAVGIYAYFQHVLPVKDYQRLPLESAQLSNGKRPAIMPQAVQQSEAAEESVALEGLEKKHSASREWQARLRKEHATKPVYTAQVQEALADPGRQPILFFGRLEDIRKTQDGYVVQFSSTRSPELPPIYYDLVCASAVVERLRRIEELSRAGEDFAVVAEVGGVERPQFPIATQRHESGEVQFHLGPEKLFLVAGRCVDFAFRKGGFKVPR